MTHPSVKECTCGHLEVDHLMVRTPRYVIGGACRECDCREFRKANAAATDPSTQEHAR